MSTSQQQLHSLSCGPNSLSEGYLETLIDLFYPFLVKNLLASNLLSELQLEEVKRKAYQIHKLDVAGKTEEAATELLSAIRQTPEPNKWMEFLQALRNLDCEIIVNALLGETERDTWHHEHRELIEIFKNQIEQHLDLTKIMPNLRELFLFSDYLEIMKLVDTGRQDKACFLFLMRLHRLKEDWYEKFMNTLYFDDHYRELAKRIDNDFCNKLEAQGQSESNPPSLLYERSGQNALVPVPVNPIKQTAKDINTSKINSNPMKGMHPKITDKMVTQWVAADVDSSSVQDPNSTCACGCCVQIKSEVISLKSEINSLKSYMIEMNQLLQSFVFKNSSR